MQGRELIRDIISATGLPKAHAEQELVHFISGLGIDAEKISLEDLRKALALYLQDVIINSKRALSSEQSESNILELI